MTRMRLTYISTERWRELASLAIQAGAARPHVSTIRWDVCGDGRQRCLDPYPICLVGSDGPDRSEALRGLQLGRVPTTYGSIELMARCRRCAACRRAKSAYWARRAALECARAKRVWFITLTLSPEQRYLHAARARARYARTSALLAETGEDPVGWDFMSETQQFSRISAEVGKTVTLYLKRVRRRSPSGALRHMTVVERHADGAPHVHLLLFEQIDRCTSERTLRGIWRNEMKLGLSQAQLVRDQRHAPWYVCKYISKSIHRVRASLFFGKIKEPIFDDSSKYDVEPRSTKFDCVNQCND